MRLYGLRLLVALLTFAAGIAASTLFSPSRKAPCMTRVVAQVSPVIAPVPLVEVAPPAETQPKTPNCAYTGPVEAGILDDKAVKKPAAIYPAAAIVAGVEGTVAVRVVVDSDGTVTQAAALSGPKLLLSAAVDAAHWAKFPPTRINGCSVTISGVVTYNFKLD